MGNNACIRKDIVTDRESVDKEFLRLYNVSRDGVVVNKKTKKVVSQHENGRGYKMVNCTVFGKGYNFYVHRMVAKRYLLESRKNVSDHINHKNSNKSDNRVDNLEWCTHRENDNHTKLNKLNKMGAEHYNSKLNEFDVLYIRDFHRRKIINNTNLAKLFKVHVTTIRSIIRYRSWKHVP